MTAPNRGGTHRDRPDVVVIGLTEIYQQVRAVAEGQTNLAAKLDTALLAQQLYQQSIAGQIADLRHDQTDHEARIRAIEARPVVTPRSMWAAISTVAAVAATVLALIQLLQH